MEAYSGAPRGRMQGAPIAPAAICFIDDTATSKCLMRNQPRARGSVAREFAMNAARAVVAYDKRKAFAQRRGSHDL